MQLQCRGWLTVSLGPVITTTAPPLFLGYPLHGRPCAKHFKVKVNSLSRVQLFATPWTVGYQTSPSMGFSRQEYRSGLPFPSPGDLPDPGIEPGSPTLEADALTSKPPGDPLISSPFQHQEASIVIPFAGPRGFTWWAKISPWFVQSLYAWPRNLLPHAIFQVSCTPIVIHSHHP